MIVAGTFSRNASSDDTTPTRWLFRLRELRLLTY